MNIFINILTVIFAAGAIALGGRLLILAGYHFKGTNRSNFIGKVNPKKKVFNLPIVLAILMLCLVPATVLLMDRILLINIIYYIVGALFLAVSILGIYNLLAGRQFIAILLNALSTSQGQLAYCAVIILFLVAGILTFTTVNNLNSSKPPAWNRVNDQSPSSSATPITNNSTNMPMTASDFPAANIAGESETPVKSANKSIKVDSKKRVIFDEIKPQNKYSATIKSRNKTKTETDTAAPFVAQDEIPRPKIIIVEKAPFATPSENEPKVTVTSTSRPQTPQVNANRNKAGKLFDSLILDRPPKETPAMKRPEKQNLPDERKPPKDFPQ